VQRFEPVIRSFPPICWARIACGSSRLLGQADPATVPQLYVCCGTEDPLYEENLAFRDACHAAGVPLTADFGTGEHAWDYWDAKIQQVLSWLPLTGC
jgi:putative tributyrin esterase